MTNKDNTNITFKGVKLQLSGPALKEGMTMPPFLVTGQDLGDIKSDSFKGKILVLSTVPSLDTPVCSIETKRFNQEASKLSSDVKVLTVSYDLPFAQKRWCGAEGVTNITVASEYKHRSLGKAYGVFIDSLGLLARAVFVIDPNGRIAYLEYVPEIAQEPDYQAVLKAVADALGR